MSCQNRVASLLSKITHRNSFHISSQRATSSRPTNRNPSKFSNMRASPQSQPSNESLPSYIAGTSAETLPGYALFDLNPPANPPAKAHTHMTHTEAAAPAPAQDYVEAQPQLAFDAEANIARSNAPNVSIAHIHIFICEILF
jgi:hypothetical protein